MAITIHSDVIKNAIGLVIFNLNDVLLDTSLIFEAALRNTLRDFYSHLRINDFYYLEPEYKLPIYVKLQKLKNDLKMPQHLMEKMDWCFEEYAKESIQYMYLEDQVIDCLNGIKNSNTGIAVISNTRKELLREIIQVTKLNEHVDFIKCAKDSDIENIIPDKHIIEYTCSSFKMPRSNTLHIGLTLQDAFMAQQAGVHSVTVDGVEDVNSGMLAKISL